MFKRRCVTQQLLATVIILSVAIVIGKGVGGQWHYDQCSGGQRAAQTTYRQGICPTCMVQFA